MKDTVDMPLVMILEDHQLLGQLVALELERSSIPVELAELDDQVELRVLDRAPRLVLLDIDLGLRRSSLELCRSFVMAGLAVVVFTGVTDQAELGAFLEAGAVGVLAKVEPLEMLASEIGRALAGNAIGPAESVREGMRTALADRRAARRTAFQPFEQLSDSEKEVLQLMCDGKTPKEIAELRFVSLATVRSQIRAILSKLGVNSQLGAITLANKIGWA